MSQANYLIEPEQLEAISSKEHLVIIDLCKAKQYAQAHIPGAHFVSYADIVKVNKPVMGLLPDDEDFSALISSLGITEKHRLWFMMMKVVVAQHDHLRSGGSIR